MSDSVKVSVIVPAYREVGNIPELIRRVFTALSVQPPVVNGSKGSWDAEMVIVDDNSNDGSVEAVAKAASSLAVKARIVVRTTERGLSSAVLRGFDEAKGDYLLCMDADLQHPPEKVPDLLSALANGAEFVLGTRYGAGVAIDASWPLYRRVISKGARLLAQPLTPLSDPMTGFFGISKAAYARGVASKQISPIGFKIAMEIYVKCGITRHVEVPFSFGVRTFGESKLSPKVIGQYLTHLGQLYRFRHPLLLVILVLFVLFVLFAIAKRLL